jgi:hypothetical protein
VTALAAAAVAINSEASASQAATTRLTAASKAVGNAINVRLSDLPGFHVGSSDGVTDGGDPGNQFKRCYGKLPKGSADNDDPSVSSPDFVKSSGGGEGVSLLSAVSFPSPAGLARDRAEASNARFPQCVADAPIGAHAGHRRREDHWQPAARGAPAQRGPFHGRR